MQELEIKEHLCHIKNILNKKPKDLSKKLSLLNIIAHLFKDDAYKHEQEVRLLYSTDDLSDLESDERDTPHFYYDYNKLPLREVEKVILGPQSKDDYRYFLQSKNKQNGNKIKLIKKSEIKYRS